LPTFWLSIDDRSLNRGSKSRGCTEINCLNLSYHRTQQSVAPQIHNINPSPNRSSAIERMGHFSRLLRKCPSGYLFKDSLAQATAGVSGVRFPNSLSAHNHHWTSDTLRLRGILRAIFRRRIPEKCSHCLARLYSHPILSVMIEQCRKEVDPRFHSKDISAIFRTR
jgi:hypothetical protein